jgi:hypothetical protein
MPLLGRGALLSGLGNRANGYHPVLDGSKQVAPAVPKTGESNVARNADPFGRRLPAHH